MVFRETGTRLTAVRLAMSTPPSDGSVEHGYAATSAAYRLLPWNHPLRLGTKPHQAVEMLQRMVADRDPTALAIGRVYWRGTLTDDDLLGRMSLMGCRYVVARLRGWSDWKRYLRSLDEDDVPDPDLHYINDIDAPGEI